MKTIVIISVIVLFLCSINYFFTKCTDDENCSTDCDDKRIDKIRRAKKNLHPTINRNVDRDENGRFCKRK